MADGDVLRLQAHIEQMRVAPEGEVLVILRCHTGAAVSKLLRHVGDDCAIAVMLASEAIAPGAAQHTPV